MMRAGESVETYSRSWLKVCRSTATRMPRYSGMNSRLQNASTPAKAENIEPPRRRFASTSKLCEMRKPSDVMNSPARKRSSMMVTARLRTACRSSLTTMGFNSQSRQPAKWVLMPATFIAHRLSSRS